MVTAENEKMIDALLKDFDGGHTEYQIENFIVGTEIHPWHQYVQCLREIGSRYEAIKNSRESLKSNVRRKFLFFRSKPKKKKIDQAKRSIAKNEKELNHFLEIAIEIKKQFGGELTEEKKKVLEAEAWREKAKYLLCMDLFCIGRPSKQTIEFIYKLPRETKRELLMNVDPRDQKKIIEYLIE